VTKPNTLIFVDLASDDPNAAGRFYAEVFGWEDDARMGGSYHRMVPGGNFPRPDGTDSEIGNLHLGIFDAANVRPYPRAEGAGPRVLSRDGRTARIWVLISDDDTAERILGAAERLGAEILWQNHYWTEFNGLNHAFRDPWGNEIVLWGKAGKPPVIPAGYTKE
jgi:catechol 2,3-dioxygenase-like lactoylglutathione lyase family enzyme